MKTITMLQAAAIVAVASSSAIPHLSLTSNDVPISAPVRTDGPKSSVVMPALEPSGFLMGVATAQAALPTTFPAERQVQEHEHDQEEHDHPAVVERNIKDWAQRVRTKWHSFTDRVLSFLHKGKGGKGGKGGKHPARDPVSEEPPTAVEEAVLPTSTLPEQPVGIVEHDAHDRFPPKLDKFIHHGHIPKNKFEDEHEDEHEDDGKDDGKGEAREILGGLRKHPFGYKTVPKYTLTTKAPTPTPIIPDDEITTRNKARGDGENPDEHDNGGPFTIVVGSESIQVPANHDRGVMLPNGEKGALTATVIRNGKSVTMTIGVLPTLVAKRCDVHDGGAAPAESASTVTATVTSVSTAFVTQTAELAKRCESKAAVPVESVFPSTSASTIATSVGESTTAIAGPDPVSPTHEPFHDPNPEEDEDEDEDGDEDEYEDDEEEEEVLEEDTIKVYVGDDIIVIPLTGPVSVSHRHNDTEGPSTEAVSATVVQNGHSVTLPIAALPTNLPLGKDIPSPTTTNAVVLPRETAENRAPLETSTSSQHWNWRSLHLPPKPHTTHPSPEITNIPTPFVTSTRRSNHHGEPDHKDDVFTI